MAIPIDIKRALEGAELVAYEKNEKLYRTVNGLWVVTQKLKGRLRYSTCTPWEARNIIKQCSSGKNPRNYQREMETLKKYNLEGDKQALHFPYIDQKIYFAFIDD